MTPAAFRKIALELPEAVEKAHGGHPDFRVRGKIFASLGHPDAGWGTVKLMPQDKAMRLATMPEAFVPAAGAWGRNGWTQVKLAALDAAAARGALIAAWCTVAPKSLRAIFDRV